MTEQIGIKQNAPNAVAALVLGILSILSGCLFIGLILGIIGVVLASNGMKAYMLNPDAYTNVGMLKAGKILSILGIVFSGVYILVALIAGGSSLFLLEPLLDLL